MKEFWTQHALNYNEKRDVASSNPCHFLLWVFRISQKKIYSYLTYTMGENLVKMKCHTFEAAVMFWCMPMLSWFDALFSRFSFGVAWRPERPLFLVIWSLCRATPTRGRCGRDAGLKITFLRIFTRTTLRIGVSLLPEIYCDIKIRNVYNIVLQLLRILVVEKML